MRYFLLKVVYSATMKQKLFQALLLGIIFAGFVISNFTQQLSPEMKASMIDSANDSRIENYLLRCFPSYATRIKFEQDSSELCSVDIAMWVANDISDDQFPRVEKFMVNVSKYYNNHGLHILIQYGIIPGSIDLIYDRMFNNKALVIYWPEKNITYSRTEELVGAFNDVTYSYIGKKNKFAAYSDAGN
jgi:hypothetical protein